ncbi:hypothetical protein TSUD_02380 [Trifolium subterraneum]|nr:hypothetical protein TSUD_02380 [Trifolium subterraneum]
MKQKQSTRYDDDDVLDWSKSEVETAEIISALYHCFSLFSSVSYSWGCKKKRSAIQNTPSSDGGAAVVPPSSDAGKAQASSPATPLSFPATESDEKTKPSKNKTSLKRKREYYLKMIEDLTKTKDSINQDIENVKRHCEQLKEFNLKLKAREKELLRINGPKVECKNPNLENNCPIQLNHHIIKVSVNSLAENEEKMKQQIQILNHQNKHNFGLSQICNDHPTTSLQVASSSVGRNSNMGPLSIPDLNLSIEESVHVEICQPLDEAPSSNNNNNNKDLSKVMAAQARQRRIQIFRLKKPVGNNNNNNSSTKQRQSYNR